MVNCPVGGFTFHAAGAWSTFHLIDILLNRVGIAPRVRAQQRAARWARGLTNSAAHLNSIRLHH